MIIGIRFVVALVPLVLLIAGCGEPDRHRTSYDRSTRNDSRNRNRSPAHVHDERDTRRGPAPDRYREKSSDQRSAIEWRYDVTLAEIRQHQKEHTAVILDVREAGAFNQGHLRGAINLPSSQKEEHAVPLQQNMARSQLMIIYCNGPRCAASDTVFEYLTSLGFTNMKVYRPGWDALASSANLR